MSNETREREILRMLKSSYEQRGYSFVVHPPSAILPAFLGEFRPDAIALKEPGGVVIEVVSGSDGSRARVKKLNDLFTGQREWGFEIVTARQEDAGTIPSMTRQELTSELGKIAGLAAVDERAAFLLAWAVLEAASRITRPKSDRSPDRAITPAQIPDILAGDGLITQATANWLRDLARARNTLAHGDLKRHISRGDVDRLVSVARDLLDEAADAPAVQ